MVVRKQITPPRMVRLWEHGNQLCVLGVEFMTMHKTYEKEENHDPTISAVLLGSMFILNSFQ